MLQKPHIAFFDDNYLTRTTFQAILEATGFRVSTYASPCVPPEIIDPTPPVLIIVDWLFNREPRGSEVVDQVRYHPLTASTPIIICTALPKGSVLHHEMTLRARGVDVLYKPFGYDTLINMIRACIFKEASEQREGQVCGKEVLPLAV